MREKNYRYEKKAFLKNFDYKLLKFLVKTSPFNFYQPYESRWINNIYLDNYDFSAFKNNIEGNASRKKLRIRWYGENFGTGKKVLELKIKQGHVGTKKYFNLENFEVSKNTDSVSLMNNLKNLNLEEEILKDLKLLKPSVGNRYKRDYFVSMDGKIRITVDKNLIFQSWFFSGINKQKLIISNSCILEVKFDKDKLDIGKEVFASFGIRSTKSSKYVMAVDALIAKGYI